MRDEAPLRLPSCIRVRRWRPSDGADSVQGALRAQFARLRGADAPSALLFASVAAALAVGAARRDPAVSYVTLLCAALTLVGIRSFVGGEHGYLKVLVASSEVLPLTAKAGAKSAAPAPAFRVRAFVRRVLEQRRSRGLALFLAANLVFLAVEALVGAAQPRRDA